MYAELHCRTNFSFLEGASHADELVSRAIELRYSALAITDRHSLAGVVRAHAAAKDSDLKLLIGAEIAPTDAAPIVLLATDRAAYGRLARLVTLGRRRAPKGECELTLDDIAQHSEGLLATVVGGLGRDPAYGEYRDIFADRGYLLAELHYGTNDAERLDQLVRLSKQTRLPLVAAGDVHYHVAQRMMLQHVLTAIRYNTTVEALGDRLLPNAERHLRTLDEIQQVFARVPDAVRRTMEVADRCTFSLDDLRYEYPEELAPADQSPYEYLRQLTWQGARQRYQNQVPESIKKQLEHELAIIKDLRYEAFFLTVYDIVKFARSQNILCQGRGSAANSSVCFCLGITAVDPMDTDLLFERFVSRERNEAPDIDVDFEHERREEVLQYVYNKYSRDRAGLAATVITYRVRSAVRDVGKALGLSLDRIDALAKNIDGRSEDTILATRCQQSGVDPTSRVGRQLMTLVNEILGFPRHLSQHVGGMVITQGPLCELVPIENAAMVDRTVIQWDKDDLDTLGILKVDCLALGMLTAIHRCFDLIEQHHGRQLSIANIRQDDSDVYDMISRAETVGVFQIESRAQMSMLPRLRPERFYDIVIEVAIVRPGPIQGDMVHPYLDRRDRVRKGETIEPICADDKVNKVLERTLGVPLFQEQAMQLAVVAAGFTPGEADQLRKAMGGWRRPGLIDSFRQKLFDGMLERGHTEEFAERLFKQISGFGEYGFPESHAASFAKLAYVSAWLRYHYQAAFTAALINSQPMGFYAPAQLIRDARERRDTPVEVLPIDINHSDWDCTLEKEGQALRLGLRLVRGLHRAVVDSLVQARTRRFESITDLVARTNLSQAVIERLSAADAFQSCGLDRRKALWQALDQAPKHEQGPRLFDLQSNESLVPMLPKLEEQEEVFADYHSAGLTLRRHPLSFHREQLNSLGVTPAGQLVTCPHDHMVKVAGVVLMRQRPSTAKGITFVTLEDETGIANLVVHQSTWQRYDQAARRSTAMIAYGKLERKNEVVHVIARRLEDLTDRLASLHSPSRDFR
ncbi:MAG: error-prone DNA polymerase [Planctomycetaceae bacterium]|nr:error-prone DNA polymerase [Planctomycetaceae bacterium]MCB9937389.1 error-prone DNA polymerase [Planctomycetaceae bacterium]